jgi:hypothetical protein
MTNRFKFERRFIIPVEQPDLVAENKFQLNCIAPWTVQCSGTILGGQQPMFAINGVHRTVASLKQERVGMGLMAYA